MTSLRNTPASDESGATLVFALILITVIGLVSAASLALADTSLRSTVSMRAVSSTAYAGDAAAEVALNQLRLGQFNGSATGCDTSSTEVLANLYPATGTATGASAAVTCTADVNAGASGGANSSPGTAVLALATGSESGILLDDTNNSTLKVNGGIFSNSTIDLTKNRSDLENTATNSYAFARGGCILSGAAQVIVAAGSVMNCNYVPGADRRGLDPGTVTGHGASFDAPAGPGPARTPPGCGTPARQVYDLLPGLYTNAALLNTLISCGAGSVVHLTPGTYFFDFPAGSPSWNVSNGYLVGGTSVGTLTTSPTMPGSCVNPGSAAATTTSGVRLVFGGLSRMSLSGTGSIELCASNSASGPPIVIYGLKSAVGAVPAESGCIIAVGYGVTGDAAHCPVLSSDNSPTPLITLWGTTYVPRAVVDLTMNDNNVSVFRWGLMTRAMRFHAIRSATMTSSLIDVPSDAPAPFATPSQRYLSVFVCPGSSTCSTAGTLRLRAGVILSASTPRTVTVTSWATVR